MQTHTHASAHTHMRASTHMHTLTRIRIHIHTDVVRLLESDSIVMSVQDVKASLISPGVSRFKAEIQVCVCYPEPEPEPEPEP